MRPDVPFIEALRAPPAHFLQTLWALQPQNQLRVGRMAETQVRHEAASAAAFVLARAQGLKSALAVLGLAVVAALAAVVLQMSGAVEQVVLGLLAILAVGGVFLIFGLLSGFLRLGERANDSDITKTIADGLDGGLQLVDQGGKVIYSNASLQRLAGRRAGRNATLEGLLAGEPGAAQAFFRLNRAAERGDVCDEEFYVRQQADSGPAGRWLRIGVRAIAAPGEDASARPLTLWQVTDITREKKREIDTVNGLEATLAFYDNLPQGLLAVAPDGRIAHVNATLAQWLGLTESGRALTLRDFVSADGAALIRGVGRGGEPRTTRLELDLLREDGRAFPAQLICRSHGGRGMISVLVLERTSDLPHQGTRAEIEARLSRLFHAAPVGIATADRDGRIVTTNAAFTRMFSIEDRAAPAGVASLVPPGQEEAGRALAKALERAISGRAGAAPVEVTFGPKNELARRIYVSPLGVGKRGREGAILYAIDATEQKALELKFAQSHKMEAVGQLAGGVAHDFNNVLTAIIGFSDLLLQTHRPTDSAYRDIMNIKNSANRAAGLVRQLLAFSRRQTLQAEVLELGEVLTDLSALLNRALGERIELKILPGRDLWHVKADKTQFEQVIINLAVNARDAMPDGGRLTIRTRNISERESLKLADLNVTAGEYVLIEVEDTGIGMSTEVAGKIFEPFFTTKDVGKGTGLGLSTVYGIVKQTGGYVFAESEEGKGTMFRVYLPRHIVESEDELPQRADKKKEGTRDLTGTGRVLLVEDEDVVRNFAARALSRQGYEVLEAGTGLEALDVMEREGGRIDIIVSDVIMPEMDGPSMLKEMRKTKPDIKIIFVSGYPDDAFKRSLDDNEVYAFLPKPFTLPQLAAKVKEELGR
jgi:two-component system, cell cycle sensor histidine kinase and response regulator CckA